MGFPDNYTLLPKCKVTQRYKATGSSWATNVITDYVVTIP